MCRKDACKAADCAEKGFATPHDAKCRVCTGGHGYKGTGLCQNEACVAADCKAKGGSGPHKRARGSSASAAAAPAASSASAPDPASASVLAGGVTEIVEDADGDCLYHALARFVTGSPDSTAQVRREIAAYIQQSPAAFAVFAEGDQTVADLAHGVATNAWGGAETLQAFAQLTGAQVVVARGASGQRAAPAHARQRPGHHGRRPQPALHGRQPHNMLVLGQQQQQYGQEQGGDKQEQGVCEGGPAASSFLAAAAMAVCGGESDSPRKKKDTAQEQEQEQQPTAAT